MFKIGDVITYVDDGLKAVLETCHTIIKRIYENKFNKVLSFSDVLLKTRITFI